MAPGGAQVALCAVRRRVCTCARVCAHVRTHVYPRIDRSTDRPIPGSPDPEIHRIPGSTGSRDRPIPRSTGSPDRPTAGSTDLTISTPDDPRQTP